MAFVSAWRRLSSATLLLALLIAWEIFSRWILPAEDSSAQLLLPPPSQGVMDAINLIREGVLWQDVAASSRRVYVGFSIAALIAIPLGIAMGHSRRLDRQLSPLIGILRPIPPVAWIPITLLWFGVTNAQQYFIIFIGTFFPILLNTIAGVHNVDPIVYRAASSLGAQRTDLFRVSVRAALPAIFVGIRTSLGLAWFIIVASEMVPASTGLGFLIIESRTAMVTQRLYVGMFIIGFIGYAQDHLLLFLKRTLMPWI